MFIGFVRTCNTIQLGYKYLISKIQSVSNIGKCLQVDTTTTVHPSMDEETWSDLGSLQLATDESHEFGKMCKIREAARHAFVKADMGSRVSRAILRKAAPVSKEYQCGDLVCYKTQQGGWSTASRVIGFDGPKIVWVIHRGVPVCVGLDKLRPVNASEALAHQYLHGQKPFQFGSRHQQQGYIDARLDNTEVGESARPAARPNDPEEDETLAEEFADRPSEGRRVRFGTAEEPDVEEMPPSRRRSREGDVLEEDTAPDGSRRRLNPGSTAEESRANVDSSSSSDRRHDLAESMIRAGTTGRGVEMVRDTVNRTMFADSN